MVEATADNRKEKELNQLETQEYKRYRDTDNKAGACKVGG